MLCILLFVLLCSGCSFSSEQGTAIEWNQIVEEQENEIQKAEEEAYHTFKTNADIIYNEMFEMILGSSEEMNEKPLSERLFRGSFQLYSMIRSMSPMLFVCSMGIGIVLWITARHNKVLRKIGIYGFMIGIPIFLILFVYGFGILMDLFLY